MTGPPTVTVSRGSPTDEERAAVEAAFLHLWRHASREARARDPWVSAARAAATSVSERPGGRHMWRLAARDDGWPTGVGGSNTPRDSTPARSRGTWSPDP